MLDRVFLNGGSGGGGWIGILTSGQIDEPNGITLDNDKNIYLNGYTTNPSTPYGYAVIKLSNLGVIQFQKKLSVSYNAFGSSVTVDKNNNSLYAIGYASLIGGSRSPVLAKYNLSGTLQWQRGFDQASRDVYTSGVTTDSGGNIYFCGQGPWTGNSSYDTGYYSKYNSSGTFQVIKNLKVYTNDQVRSDGMASIKVDNSGNIFTVGYTSDYRPPNYFPSRYPNTWNFIVTAKFDSANNLLWLKKLMSGPNAYGNDNALNSSGDIYVAGQTGYSGTTQCLLLKYNTSGSLLWQRELGDPSKDQGWQKIAIDGSGNVYCAGYCNVTSDADILLAKYNSSGALQWQRRFGRSGAGDYCNGLTVDSDGNLYFCSSISTNNGDMLVANLPSDGSGMGTYSVNGTSFTYAITSLTDTTPTYTHDAEAFAAGGNLSNTGQQNTNLTDGNLSLTSVVTQI